MKEENIAPKSSMNDAIITVNHAVVPNAGEDSFAFETRKTEGYLCIADGCGGLGAKRYSSQNNTTGARLAADLAIRMVQKWMKKEGYKVPDNQQEARELCNALAAELYVWLKKFEAENAQESRIRIVNRMQRALPTTLCLAIFSRMDGWVDALFIWAGDSRGYVLNKQGLHQVTEDHLQGAYDPMNSLYKEAPLSRLANADSEFEFSARRIRCETPCIVVLATDGAFAYLPTPMEFEWLLLSTMYASKTLQGWQSKLNTEIAKIACDDGTLLIALFGYIDFECVKADVEERRLWLQREYITPVRRHKCQFAYAREKWKNYQKQYDWTKGMDDDAMDWRI